MWVLPEWHYGLLSRESILTAVSLLALPLLHLAASYTNPGYIVPEEEAAGLDAEKGGVNGAEGGSEGRRMVCMSGYVSMWLVPKEVFMVMRDHARFSYCVA